MLRVLFVSGTVPPVPCGVGDYTLRLAQALSAAGKAETAILTGCSTLAIPANGPVRIFPRVSSWKASQFPAVLGLLRQWKPDVVHVQYPTQGYGRGMLPSMIPLLARFLGICTVQTWHEGFGRRYLIKLLLQVSARSRQIVVRSNFMSLVHPSLQRLVARSNPLLIANASAIPQTLCTVEERRAVKLSLLRGQRRLIVFFGFLLPAKGVEQLFEIADPGTDHIVIAGPSEEGSAYVEKLKALAESTAWQGKVTFTGFLSPDRAALILSISDAVILPFRQGGGPWNTSLHSATVNGAFVITTSATPARSPRNENIYYALPDDVADMRHALQTHCSTAREIRILHPPEHDEWVAIASRHSQIYEECLGGTAR